MAEDIRIPKIIFENIQSNIKAESISIDPVYLFQSLEVIIESEAGQTAVVKSKFKFTNGGGLIDLKKIITGQGSFYFYLPLNQFEKLPELEHMYFMSEYPIKNIDHENFGTGCGTWMDLKKNFSKFTDKKIKLNTNQQRYLYVAAGYYVFVFRKSNQVYLTHLHLTDTNYNQLKCPELKEAMYERK
jgi:hypothetical protein